MKTSHASVKVSVRKVETAHAGVKLLVKKIVVNAANFELGLKNLQGDNDKIKEQAHAMEGEFQKVLDVIVSVIESMFLGNLLDL